MDYVPNTLVKISKKTVYHVDTVDSSIQPLNFSVLKAISSTHNYQRSPFNFYRTNFSTSSHVGQYVVYDEISNSYYDTTSYTIDWVVFQGTKL